MDTELVAEQTGPVSYQVTVAREVIWLRHCYQIINTGMCASDAHAEDEDLIMTPVKNDKISCNGRVEPTTSTSSPELPTMSFAN